MIIKPLDHPSLPPSVTTGPTLRETVFGVDTPQALGVLAERLKDCDLTRDADGTVHFTAPDGNRYGLRVWAKRRVFCAPDRVNAPDAIVRLNQHRKWRARAQPKTINHVVYFSEDYVGAYEFFRDRLGFSMSDHARANGIFARADGTHEHHTIFWVTTAHPPLHRKRGFTHCAFGVEDIDEPDGRSQLHAGSGLVLTKDGSPRGSTVTGSRRPSITTSPIRAAAMRNTMPTPTIWTPAGSPASGRRTSAPPCGARRHRGFFRDGGSISWDVALDPGELSLNAFRHHGRKAEEARDAAAAAPSEGMYAKS